MLCAEMTSSMKQYFGLKYLISCARH